jgi:hypothetical protein
MADLFSTHYNYYDKIAIQVGVSSTDKIFIRTLGNLYVLILICLENI